MCDLVVVGSGAAGLSAAVTARKAGLSVIVLEKEPEFGGTTARSGGYLWVPNNPVNAGAGSRDTIDAARTYIAHEAGNAFDAEKVDAFLAAGAKMVEFFERETEVKFLAAEKFPDYHAEMPGGAMGGRSILCAPYDGRRLGRDIARLGPPLREITFVGMLFSASQEVRHFFNATRSLHSTLYVVRRLAQHGYEMLRFGRPMRLTNGNALVARLARTALDCGIALRVNSPVTALSVADDRVTGVSVTSPQGTVSIGARRGVVLACGGLSHDLTHRATLFGRGEHLSPAAPGATGDGLRLATVAGGVLNTALASPAAWVPVSRVPRRRGHGVFPHLVDRYKPGVIAVSPRGVRFVNEANSYHDFCEALMKACAGDTEARAWLVCDHQAIRRYGLGYVKPFPLPLASHLRSGYLQRGSTPTALATRIGVDPDTFVRTLAHYNAGAREGRDPEFGRGTTAYNRYMGDQDHAPNPCVAPIAAKPFYAIKVMVGDLATFAGLKTDRYARVLRTDGTCVSGLYAVGNDMASVMGGAYPGAGITLGPGMTFGYIAGQHAAAHADAL